MQLIKNRKVILIVLLAVFVLLAIVTSLYILFGALAAVAVGGYVYGNRIAVDTAVAEQLTDPQKQLESIAAVHARPDFRLQLANEATAPPAMVTSRSTDSVEA